MKLCLLILALLGDFDTGFEHFMEGEFDAAYKALEPAASNGDAMAQYVVGLMNLKGYGTPINFAQGVKWLSKASQKNFAQAHYQLAECYRLGMGVERDPQQAHAWYRKAAQWGSSFAMNNIGAAYAQGGVVDVDLAEAFAWFTVALKAGNKVAAGNVDYCRQRLRAERLKQAEARAVALEKELADGRTGDSINFQFNLRDAEDAAVQKGEKAYLARDYDNAKRYLLPPGRTGHEVAAFYLARMNQMGRGFERDFAAAVRWYGFAVKKGQLMAVSNLAYLVRDGQGTKKDEALAAKLWLAAAWRGIWSAQAEIGVCYYRGQGVARDRTEAVAWWLVAAENGDEIARNNLKAAGLDDAAMAKARPRAAAIKAQGKAGTDLPPIPEPPEAVEARIGYR